MLKHRSCRIHAGNKPHCLLPRRSPLINSLSKWVYICYYRIKIVTAGGAGGIRDIDRLKSALGAAQASFDGQLLMGLFEIAATYVNSTASNHPFLDGNKITGIIYISTNV